MKTLVLMPFGSHLYGTSTPTSDLDYKAVFMPSKEQILLGRIPKSINENTKKKSDTKNTSGDIDMESYSLHYFIHLACEGETVALDMLHAPMPMLIKTSSIWHEIIENREKFYTKNLKAFIGYARRQAAKYGIKGSRLNDSKRVVDFLSSKVGCPEYRLSAYWFNLPEGEFIHKHLPNENGERMYEVCGRKVGENATIHYALDVYKRFLEAYGERAKKAAQNEGIDWKAISHAFRAAYQVKEILTKGTITFPLKEAEYLKKIKEGAIDFQTEASPRLDALMEEVETLSEQSTLPMKPDRKFWDGFILHKTYESIHDLDSREK